MGSGDLRESGPGRAPAPTSELIHRVISDLGLEQPPALHEGPVWLSVTPTPGPWPEDGWKLHVSARTSTLERVAEKTARLLLREGCPFKLVVSGAVLSALNDGGLGAAQVGKAITVYPAPGEVERIGRLLVDLLDGEVAPRVLSDRRISDDAPVYYRYGPFTARWVPGEQAALSQQLLGPHGEAFDALAEMEYRQPPWVTDPFGSADTSDDRLLGGRYQIDEGVYRSAKGNVFRGVDQSTGRRVVVKQARAYVAEDTNGVDARLRLRNERRILTSLGSLAGVPEFIDHFAHGDDEYLVTDDAGPENLLTYSRLSGAYRPSTDADENATATKNFLTLAGRLADVVERLHDHGVIMRDLSPRNIAMADGVPTVIDFGISAMDGLHLNGATPGFAPWRQRRGADPLPADDCHGLGMTLAYAATGLVPVGEGAAAERILGSVRTIHGLDSPQLAVVAALVDEDRGESALAELARGSVPSRPASVPAGLPEVSDADVADLTRIVLDTVLDNLHEQLLSDRSSYGGVDAGIYTGSAGVGLELLHHGTDPRVEQAVADLVKHAQSALPRVQLPAGLYHGATGAHLFLRRAGVAKAELPEASGPGPSTGPDVSDDLMSGLAGVGLGHLLQYQQDGSTDDLARADEVIRQLVDADHLHLIERQTDLPPGAALDSSYGYAHGLAGVLDFFRSYVAATGDSRTAETLDHAVRRTVPATQSLVREAGLSAAVPMSVSWCQGLAGIAPALYRAALVIDDLALRNQAIGTAVDAAEVALAWVPQLDSLTRCCGATGVGELFLDLWQLTGDERFRQAARTVVGHFLLRNRGSDDAPLFISFESDAPLAWGLGNTGVLTFLRRFRDDTAFDLTY